MAPGCAHALAVDGRIKVANETLSQLAQRHRLAAFTASVPVIHPPDEFFTQRQRCSIGLTDKRLRWRGFFQGEADRTRRRQLHYL